MPHLIGLAFVVVMAVVCVWALGGVLGAVAWLVIVGGTLSALKFVSRRYFDPMAAYDEERRSITTEQPPKF